MKIIFLGIDGVLNSETDFIEVSMYGHEHNSKRYTPGSGREALAPLCRGKLALLEKIITATGAKIVISSAWRERFTLNKIYKMFKRHGFNLPQATIIGKTESSHIGLSSDHTNSRSNEIRTWIDSRDDIESYVILDDIPEYLFYDHDDHLITTSVYDGLNLMLAMDAMNILGMSEVVKKTDASVDKYEESLKLLTGI